MKTQNVAIASIVCAGLSLICLAALRNVMTTKVPSLTLQSHSFANGGSIPSRFTCDNTNNISPHLRWTSTISATPEKVNSYVLVVDDPDAQKEVAQKTFVHWIVLLPPSVTELPEGISSAAQSALKSIDSNAREVLNDYNKESYHGPCPPNGTHTYRFTLFATTKSLHDLNGGIFNAPFTAEALQKSLKDSIIAEARIVGTYIKQKNRS